MNGVISLGVLLLLLGSAQSQEECITACAKTQINEKTQAACKEGCRLQVIFAFTSNSDVASAREECYNGCAKSYEDHAEKDACSFGCDKQPDMKKSRIRVSITNKSPTFEVARGAMEKMMHHISNSFPSFGQRLFRPLLVFIQKRIRYMNNDTETGKMEEKEKENVTMKKDQPNDLGLAHSEERDERLWEDRFAQFHLRMQNEMARFHQIAQNMLNLQHAQTDTPLIANNRPEGHEENALKGPRVGNKDKDGGKIIEAQPVESKSKAQPLLGLQGENPTVMEVPESSLLSRLASRARRLSALSQWLVCVALFLCLVSMLSISVAILKQIKSQRYHNLRNTHAVIPSTFVEPIPAKKVPLESAAVTNDYPLIHDSPPPAYDQLSVHKEKPEGGADNSDPKV